MSWTAADVMTRRVVCVYGDMDLRELAKLFVEKGITGAPVTTKAGTLLGIVSQTDIVRDGIRREDELTEEPSFFASARVEGHYLPRGFQIADTNTGTAADVMSPIVHTVKTSDPVESVAKLMRRRKVHRVIVTDAGKVAGIISALDLLAALYSPKQQTTARRKK